MTHIIPVVLCGGSGTRLWPLSRKSYPKQFAHILGDESLFERTIARFEHDIFAPPMVITGEDFRFIVSSLLDAACSGGRILVEPEGRNTAPPALAAALLAIEDDPEAMILLAPSDHAISDAPGFIEAVRQGTELAKNGRIVTFGIAPTRAETGYGYLALEGKLADGPQALARFVEKPDVGAAESMVADGRHLWNSGIFLMRARTLIDAFEEHSHEFIAPVEAALDGATTDLGFTRLAARPWVGLPDLSIDYAVMERANNLSVVPFGSGWNDLGRWDAVWQEMEKDADGVATSGAATALECKDTLLRSENQAVNIVGLGLENIVAVAMDDAVLVADKSRSQEVKKVVTHLKERQVRQATQLPQDYRPWGSFESLIVGNRFQVKRIQVNPGAALSLQSHYHRSEHWIVVEGTAKVTIDDTVKLVTENESVYIPLGAVHRMENPGKFPLILIEVQTGAYLGEDDIVRYEDVYARA